MPGIVRALLLGGRAPGGARGAAVLVAAVTGLLCAADRPLGFLAARAGGAVIRRARDPRAPRAPGRAPNGPSGRRRQRGTRAVRARAHPPPSAHPGAHLPYP